jgi:hypothetical protein
MHGILSSWRAFLSGPEEVDWLAFSRRNRALEATRQVSTWDIQPIPPRLQSTPTIETVRAAGAALPARGSPPRLAHRYPLRRQVTVVWPTPLEEPDFVGDRFRRASNDRNRNSVVQWMAGAFVTRLSRYVLPCSLLDFRRARRAQTSELSTSKSGLRMAVDPVLGVGLGLRWRVRCFVGCFRVLY